MNIGFMCNDSNLIERFKEIDDFKGFKISTDIHSFNNVDVLLISDNLIELNYLLEEYNSISNIKYIFYMMSDEKYSENSKILLESKDIIVIPPKNTINQIFELVINKVLDINTNKNIAIFYGADEKVGTTMIAQSVAERLATTTDKKIFLGFLNNKQSNNFINTENHFSIDSIKTKLFNNVLSFEEIISVCTQRDNLYILKGPDSLLDLRYYHPEHIDNFIQNIKNKFDVIIIDAGSGQSINYGITIGALNLSKFRFLVTTQQPSALDSFNQVKEQVLKKLQIDDFLLIINKIMENSNLYSPFEIAKFYNCSKAAEINFSNWGWQAEIDKKTLLKFDEKFTNKIDEINTLITKQLKIDIKKGEEERSWFKKIIGK